MLGCSCDLGFQVPGEDVGGGAVNPLLSPEEQADLWARKAQGDQRAVDRLVEAYTPMAYAIAQKQTIPSWVDRSDIQSQALLGLVQAVTRFDPTTSDGKFARHFSAFAKLRISGSITDYIKAPATSWVPRGVNAKVRERRQVSDALAQDLGREPTDREVADALGVEVSDLPRATVLVSMAPAVSPDDYSGLDLIGDDLDVGSSAEMSDLADRFAEVIAASPEGFQRKMWVIVSTNRSSAARRAFKISEKELEGALSELRARMRSEGRFSSGREEVEYDTAKASRNRHGGGSTRG